jgi:hypothetical protein
MLNRYFLKLKSIAKRLGIKAAKTLCAEQLYQLVRERKITYDQIKDLEPKRFQDLEYTMRLIFNHDEDQGISNSLTLGLSQ